jgi:AraC-like DNA-binding protein
LQLRGDVVNKWNGIALIETGIAGFIGRVGDNRPHRHYAVQVAVNPIAPVTVTLVNNVQIVGKLIGCPANVEHQLKAEDALTVLIYLEPTTIVGRVANRHFQSQHILESVDLASHYQSACDAIAEGSSAKLTELVSTMLNRPTTPHHGSLDRRIQSFVDSVERARIPPPTALAASQLHLSSSRFAHLFSDGCGISYRAFVKWKKLRAALSSFAGGGNLTSAAHAGGFSDSAHFSRTFSDMFGTSPVNALRGLRFSGTREE